MRSDSPPRQEAIQHSMSNLDRSAKQQKIVYTVKRIGHIRVLFYWSFWAVFLSVMIPSFVTSFLYSGFVVFAFWTWRIPELILSLVRVLSISLAMSVPLVLAAMLFNIVSARTGGLRIEFERTIYNVQHPSESPNQSRLSLDRAMNAYQEEEARHGRGVT